VKLASFEHAGRARWGVVRGDQVVDASAVAPSLMDYLSTPDQAALQYLTTPSLSIAEIIWLPVIPAPAKILCVGVNYHEHRIETGRSENGYPTIFTRFANSQTGHRAPIIRPAASADLDFEGELAVIIGKPGRHIRPADAMSHIAGFACYNDGSVRDFQRHSHQFTPGKNFIATGGFGPWMVTRDEMGAIGAQRLQTRLNGEIVQQATLDQMIFDIPAIIAYISTFTRLEPGDVIATGTPGGVGAKRTPPLWLKPGDVVEVEIDNIGILSNPVIAEGPA
jgi:2-keto-4-pentenoate hydratase/2-oxohepta-3-ene-1,7-dioic acid hydratase in catechol pathway